MLAKDAYADAFKTSMERTLAGLDEGLPSFSLSILVDTENP